VDDPLNHSTYARSRRTAINAVTRVKTSGKKRKTNRKRKLEKAFGDEGLAHSTRARSRGSPHRCGHQGEKIAEELQTSQKRKFEEGFLRLGPGLETFED
jgi:hypothetical protein